MSSRWTWITGSTILLIAVFSVNNIREKRAQRSYEHVRDSYAKDLQLGTTRRIVDEYLKNKGAKFRRLNPGGPNDNYDDMVFIAKEDPPWVCGEVNVYVDLQFSDGPPVTQVTEVNETDTLSSISIRRLFEGCL